MIDSAKFYMRIQTSDERIQKESNMPVIPAPDFYLQHFHASLCPQVCAVQIRKGAVFNALYIICGFGPPTQYFFIAPYLA
jgi:hypothetical protein